MRMIRWEIKKEEQNVVDDFVSLENKALCCLWGISVSAIGCRSVSDV